MWLAARKSDVVSSKSSCFHHLITRACNSSSKARRVNSLGVQMLSKQLHRQIFGDKKPRCSSKAILRSKEHLQEQGLWGRQGSTQPDIDVQLPSLQGDNIDEHFRTIANELAEPYLQLALEISNSSLSPMPEQWCFNSGWTRYNSDSSAESVDCPSDKALVFDVEVCVRESPRPVLAVAVGNGGWYSWVSERLVAGENFFAGVGTSATMKELIPMESKIEDKEGNTQERLIVGHNVSYDRARIREQYLIEVGLIIIYN